MHVYIFLSDTQKYGLTPIPTLNLQEKRGRSLFKGFHPKHKVDESDQVFKNFCIHLGVGLRVVAAAMHGVLVDQ